jgi:hypothetical protein
MISNVVDKAAIKNLLLLLRKRCGVVVVSSSFVVVGHSRFEGSQKGGDYLLDAWDMSYSLFSFFLTPDAYLTRLYCLATKIEVVTYHEGT